MTEIVTRITYENRDTGHCVERLVYGPDGKTAAAAVSDAAHLVVREVVAGPVDGVPGARQLLDFAQVYVDTASMLNSNEQAAAGDSADAAYACPLESAWSGVPVDIPPGFTIDRDSMPAGL